MEGNHSCKKNYDIWGKNEKRQGKKKKISESFHKKKGRPRQQSGDELRRNQVGKRMERMEGFEEKKWMSSGKTV